MAGVTVQTSPTPKVPCFAAGPRNEALVELDVSPVRKRGPRRKVAAEKKPAP